MTETTYRLFSSELFGCGFTDEEVDYYADKLAKVLASKLEHIGAIEVVRVDREFGGRSVRIYTDNDDLVSGVRRVVIVGDDGDVDPYALWLMTSLKVCFSDRLL